MQQRVYSQKIMCIVIITDNSIIRVRLGIITGRNGKLFASCSFKVIESIGGRQFYAVHELVIVHAGGIDIQGRQTESGKVNTTISLIRTKSGTTTHG